MPENKLTQYGKFVEQIIKILPNRFNVLVPKYVIMPNHIHLIIKINDKDEKTGDSQSAPTIPSFCYR